MEILLILVAIAVPFSVLGSLIWLVLKVKHLRKEIHSLQHSTAKLYDEIDLLKTQEAPAKDGNLKDIPAKEEKDHPSDLILLTKEKQQKKPAETPSQKAEMPGMAYTRVKERGAPSTPEASLFDKLTNMNVLIWIGGAALALGGLFIVKYSIEHGLLGPWGRVLSSLSLGLLMLGAGEWFRRQPEQAKKLSSWQHLPLAVSGAGFATIYAAIFTGFALYQLFPAIIAIILMAMTAAAGLAYSLLLGPVLGLLALVGAYAVPALVTTDAPSTEMLYLYLGAVLVGSFLLLRYRPWTWIGSVNLTLSFLWFTAWSFSLSANRADIIVVSLYFAVVLAVYIYQFGGRATRTVRPTSLTLFAGLIEAAGWQIYGVMTYVTVAGLGLAVSLDFDPVSYLLLLAALPVAVWLSGRDPLLEGTIWITHFGALLLLFLWPAIPVGGAEGEVNVGLIVTALLISLFYVCVGGWRIKIQDRAFLGTLNALASPLLVFCLLYWKYHGVGTAPEWSLIALVLAGGYAGAAGYVAKSLPDKQRNPLIGLFAIGATSGLSLALAAGLEAKWLTIAFALQTAAIAWINRKISVAIFRPLAALLAIIVIVRLELDSEVVRLFLGVQASVDWYLYGYGVAILAFGAAWSWFKAEKSDYLVYLLESGLILFWVTLISLAIRDGAGAYLNTGHILGISFAENSIHTFSFLLNGLGLYWLSTKNGNIVREWSWKILCTLGLFSLTAGQMFILNPLLYKSTSVGDWLFLNWLSFGFLVPAMILICGYKIARPQHIKFARIGLSLAGILGFLYINAEIRHFFSPHQKFLGNFQDTEFYTYSLGWLLYASAIMMLGIWKNSRMLRRAALLLLLATVGKVFFFDMATLDGLLRAASFLGLGSCLIGLAFLYQRFGKEDDLSKPGSAEKYS